MTWITKEIALSNLDVSEPRLKELKELAESIVARYSEEYGVTKDNAFIVRKGLLPEDVKFAEGERAVVSRITSNRKDRDSEVIEPEGAILDDFLKHPVVLFAHNYRELPVAKALWIKQDGNALIAKHQYANHAKAEEIYQYRKDGFPMAQSIGFIPISWEDHNPNEMIDGRRRTYKKWVLLEYSDVPVPCNPDALQIAVSKGWVPAENSIEEMKEYIDFNFEDDIISVEDGEEKVPNLDVDEVVNKPETTENYHRVPVSGETGKHNRHQIRTITISKKQKIKALYCVTCKKVITYLFDVDAWTMEQAQAWVSSHSRDYEGLYRKDNEENFDQIEKGIEVIDDVSKEVTDLGFGEITPNPSKSELNDQRSIFVFGKVTSGSCQQVCQQLLAYDGLDKKAPITLYIGSYGGALYPAFSVIDVMEYISAPVKTVGIGMIMSAGLLMFMAGDQRSISQNCSVLSHRFSNINWGSQAQLMADRIEDDYIHQRMIDHYIKFSKCKTKEEVESTLLKEVNVWLKADEAISHGLADEFFDNDWTKALKENGVQKSDVTAIVKIDSEELLKAIDDKLTSAFSKFNKMITNFKEEQVNGKQQSKQEEIENEETFIEIEEGENKNIDGVIEFVGDEEELKKLFNSNFNHSSNTSGGILMRTKEKSLTVEEAKAMFVTEERLQEIFLTFVNQIGKAIGKMEKEDKDWKDAFLRSQGRMFSN